MRGLRSPVSLLQSLAALCWLVSAPAAFAVDSFDGTNLTIPLVAVGGTNYSNVVITVGAVVSVAGGVSVANYDTYDAATNQLTIPSVVVGSTTYTNVTITVGTVKGWGGAATTGPAITSIDNTAPTPLTVLHIATTGLIPNAPASVTFSDSQKYSVTLPATRVASDGTVVVSTPLYTQAASGAIGPGAVSLAVSQGNKVSAPVTLAIQDLPALSSYGTTAGTITRSFLSFSANLHAIRMNELQAVQPLLNGSVDTSSARTTLGSLRDAAIASRTAVDNIINNAAYVESMTVLPDGTSLQLDQNQLVLMDRIIGAYLTQQFSAGVTSGSLALKAAQRPSAQIPGSVETRVKAASTSLVMSALTSFLASINGSLRARSWALGQANGMDAAAGIGDATASMAGLGENQWVGGFLSMTHLTAALESLFHTIGAGAACTGSSSGCTADEMNNISDNLTNSQRDIVSPVVQAVALTSPATRFAGALVNLADQTANAYENMKTLFNNGSLKAAGAVSDTLARANSSYALGMATGSIAQQTSAGGSAAQNSLNFCCFGSSGLAVGGLADLDGNYSVLIPINAAGTNYSALTMNVVDATSGSTVATKSVNLSALNSQNPAVVPTVSYCANGAKDYPTCTPPTCANGATDYPTCTPPNCLAKYNLCVAAPACNPPTDLITQNNCVNACLYTWENCT